jgi:hypothetical protein
LTREKTKTSAEEDEWVLVFAVVFGGAVVEYVNRGIGKDLLEVETVRVRNRLP